MLGSVWTDHRCVVAGMCGRETEDMVLLEVVVKDPDRVAGSRIADGYRRRT